MLVKFILEGEVGKRSMLPGVDVYWDASFYRLNGQFTLFNVVIIMANKQTGPHFHRPTVVTDIL